MHIISIRSYLPTRKKRLVNTRDDNSKHTVASAAHVINHHPQKTKNPKIQKNRPPHIPSVLGLALPCIDPIAS